MELNKLNKMRLFQQITGWSIDKIRANKKQINALLNDESISFIEQELTEEQKAQARKNINAANDSEVVKHVSQNLTSEQKAQTRENIGAGDAETVQELDEKVNGSMVTKWTVLEAESTITGKGLRSLSTSSTTSIFNKTNFSVAIFRVANGNTVRITAKKPAGSSFGPNPSDFFAYSSSSQATSFDRVASGEAKESTSSGTITNFEFLCSSDGYLAVVGDSSTPPKCEVFKNEHVPGLEERVEDLEDIVTENVSVNTLEELLSTLGTTLNGTFEKVWDDVNKKYTFTFTPGT